MRFILAILFVCLPTLVYSQGLAPQSPQAEKLNSEDRPENAIETKQNSTGKTKKPKEAAPAIPSVHAPSADRKSENKTEQGGEEGTEFWPPFNGYRLKITDTLVAIFTALLFGATLAL